MRKIENFAQISDLLNAQLKKGVITNNFLRGEDYTREIANGLYIHEADGALLLFRERGDHLVMTFYLHPNVVLSLPETDRPVVTELSCRAKDADAMANAAEQFCALGFREVLRRTRRTRKPEAFPVETTAVPAKPEDFEDISRFLSDHFSALTGCLPTADDLRENLANGQTVITRDEKGVSGRAAFCGFPRLDRDSAPCRACGLPRKRSRRRAAHRVPCGHGRREKSGLGPHGQPPCRTFLRKTRLPARRMDLRRALQYKLKEKSTMREKIIEILNEICPGNDFENETAIIDDGIIDSLDIVAVISELMEEFDVQLGIGHLTPENFNSVDAIVELIENAQD